MKKSQKSLKKWTDEDWDYVSKGDKKKPKSKRGRYLPKRVRESLTPGQRQPQIEKSVKLVVWEVELNILKR